LQVEIHEWSLRRLARMLLHLKSVLDLMLYLYFFLLIVAYPMELLEELATIGTWEDDTSEGILLGTLEEPNAAIGGVTLT
jgi:hypothetical protein